MKAVRIYRYGGPEVLTYETDAPEPELTDDAILVGTVATSVNPIDWKVRSGGRQKDFPLNLPAILGRDVSGIVQAVGSAVSTFKPGDRVIALARTARDLKPNRRFPCRVAGSVPLIVRSYEAVGMSERRGHDPGS